MTLAELTTKYNLRGARYEPNPSCKFCHGNGERPIKSRPHEKTFCICLFVAHEASDEIGGMLSQFAAQKLKEMESP